jgi:hypothetical protein
MATKAYRLFQLMKEGQVFDLNQRKEIRSSVKIDESLAELFNKNASDSGKLYVVNEEETERLFGDKKPKEIIPVVSPVTTETEEQKAQKLYDKRKAELLAVGFLFNEADLTFTKGKKVVSATDLPGIKPMQFGKLLKTK